MDASSAELVPLARALRLLGLVLAGGAAACIVLAASLGHAGGAWAAWAAGAYVSWGAALTILARRRLARAAARAKPVAGASPSLPRVAPALLPVLLLLLAAGAATGATHVTAGVLAAAASAALAASRWTRRLEHRLQSSLYADRRGRRLVKSP